MKHRWADIIFSGILLLSYACSCGRQFTAGEHELSAEAQAVLTRFNYYRVQASVPPVVLDGSLCEGCQLHADYLQLNGISLHSVGLIAHTENAALPGYTSAGAEAAANSIIYQGVGPVQAVDNWMRTLYHRLGLLDPNLTRIGFGSVGSYQVMDVASGRVSGAGAMPGTALFPSPGMVDTPVAFTNEIPYPIPDDDSLGIPITVEFFGSIGWEIRNVQADVANLTAGGTVECYIQCPGQPFLPEWDLCQLIALIPSDPLQDGHTYRAGIEARVDGLPWAAEWEFTTR